LNKRIVDMVSYAKQSGIKEVAMLSNGELLTPQLAENLVDAGLDWISFSADGTAETYDVIRAPAKFYETIEKVAYMRSYRDKKGLKKPLIRTQSVLSAFNNDSEGFLKAWKGVADRSTVLPMKHVILNLKRCIMTPLICVPLLGRELL
jgi:wyosine [tRNA(Phe)-imidazoG37] synthetase (radical SAM superfamily)